MAQVKAFFGWLIRHKGKFFLSIFSTIVFLLLLFPLGDLGDLVSTQVSKATNNQVYLQFQDLRMSLFPNAGVAFDDIYVEAKGLPAIRSQELVFTPSISSLIFQKPAGTVTARGFLRGEIEASLSPGKKSDNGIERQHITVKANSINLADLKDLANLPLQVNGSANLETNAQIDFTLQEQPEVELLLKIDKLQLPTSNLQTALGPLTLPELKVSSVELKGRLSAGRFIIENGLVGKDSDEIKGNIKGNISLDLKPVNGSVTPIFGAYQFDIDLTVKKSFQDKASLFLTFIEQYKNPLADGAQYKFKVSGTDPQNPPSLSILR